jgi:hypothetical protein
MEFDFWRLFPIVLAAPAQTAFVYIYASRRLGAGDWWGNTVGRALFLKSATLGALLDIITLVFAYNWLTGGYSGINWQYAHNFVFGVLVTGYWLVCAAVYYQLWALIKNRFYGE